MHVAETQLWSFGHGLSYGDFTFSGDSSVTLHTTVAKAQTSALCFNVTVKNSAAAPMSSDVTLLAFIASTLPDAPRNPKLCDFQREAMVKPGEGRTVKLCVGSLGPALELVSVKGERRVVPGVYTVTVGVKGSVGGVGAGTTIGKVVVAD